MEIKPLLKEHWNEIKKIYQQGIATGDATFETIVPEWEKWNELHIETCRFVAIEDNKIIGWAVLAPVSGRCVYEGVAEVSVYVDDEYKGKGIGKSLLQKLIDESEKNNIWTLQAGIFPENIASIKLHEQLGFREVGYRERIGKMNRVWRDTILFERRSKKVGVE